MPGRWLISKIKQVLLASSDEEVVDVFKPVQYKDLKGILVLTNKQVIFAEEKGTIFKSYVSVFSVKLLDLAGIEKLRRESVSYIRLGQFEVSSSDIEGLVKFYNERIFSQVQRLRGLVEYKGKWMTPEEKFGKEQLDKGLVKFKGQWMTLEEKFEREQLDKGLVKYKGSWMTPEQKFEKEMLDKGLVKYKGEWMIPEEKFEKEQEAKGLVKFMGRWGTPKQVNKWKKLYAGLTSDFMDRSPREFEKFISELFTKMGYSTSLTTMSKDFGADIIAEKDGEKTVVQVKRYKPDNKVGVKEVNQVLGSMHLYTADRAIIITTSDFTLDARKLARNAPVELWNRAKLYAHIERYFFGGLTERTLISEISSRKREAVDWIHKGLNLADLGRHEDAIEAYEWGLELIKDFKGDRWTRLKAEVWNNKGVSLGELGKFEEAMKCYDKALEINPALEVAQNNKIILQKEIEKRHVELHEGEEKAEAPITQKALAENLNLTAKGEYSEVTILHVVENNEFQCPKSCYYYDKQNSSSEYYCPKRNLMTQNLIKDRLVCTTVLAKVKNVSSQLLVLEDEYFLAFDSFGNQFIGKSLCLTLHPPKYVCLCSSSSPRYTLYSNAQVTCLLCFPQLPPDCKITRIVCDTGIWDRGTILRYRGTHDIHITG